ncbi:LolA-related protein [Methylibium sp. Root1272]|jgi:outer membrane lipoprotein-sorting protein|uniref:LolA-related protein n=2 Tax=unclassified Methylibium TaxID=2633235 RepID=UPI0006F87096|nr:LolA-related protein [Methylibium sp. Root1272]KQW66656.1 hypothetical protein ASC67_11885 [Methylibium sp. Root1272]
MISGGKMRHAAERRRWLKHAGQAAAWLALGASGAAPAAGPSFELPELMALLARRRSGEARFTELRHVQGLDQPLEASGTLSFAAPDRLARHTLQPRPESMVVEGNTLTLTRSGRSRSFALDATPELVALVEAMRATLTGNAQTLTRYFRAQLAGSAEKWTLDLVPADSRLAGQVRSVRIAGQQGALYSIEMLLVGGDRSVMSIDPLSAGTAASAPVQP